MKVLNVCDQFILQSIYSRMQQEQVNLAKEACSRADEGSSMQDDDGPKIQGRWDQDQHMRFLDGLFKYGKNWKQIETIVGTRVCSQVRSHAQKYFIKLQKIIKDRKKQKSRQAVELTEIENEVLQTFTLEDVTDKTPEILVSLLQNLCLLPNSKTPESKHTHIEADKPTVKKGFKQVPKNKSQDEEESREREEKNSKNIKQIEANPKQNTKQKSIVQLYNDQDQDQEKSFFCRVIENNVEHFRQGKDFCLFIDFEGQPKQTEEIQAKPEDNESEDTTRNRRASFTLVDDHNQNDEKIKQSMVTLKKGENSETAAK